ncbi:MAG: HTTM domain-containing protein [Polyangiaceae bacterium]
MKPRFHFKHMGFRWVRVLPDGMYALFAALAAGVAHGGGRLFYQAAIVLFFLGFSYVQLLCVTNYLNATYLVMLLAGRHGLVADERGGVVARRAALPSRAAPPGARVG